MNTAERVESCVPPKPHCKSLPRAHHRCHFHLPQTTTSAGTFHILPDLFLLINININLISSH